MSRSFCSIYSRIYPIRELVSSKTYCLLSVSRFSLVSPAKKLHFDSYYCSSAWLFWIFSFSCSNSCFLLFNSWEAFWIYSSIRSTFFYSSKERVWSEPSLDSSSI